MNIRQLIAGLMLLLITFSVAAIERQFPANAKRGVANFANYPTLTINDMERKAGPGLRIWNINNRILFRKSVHAEKLVINYTEDSMKMIDRIWILSPAEAAKTLPSQKSEASAISTTATTTANQAP